jgi:hypothetical protein
MYLLLKKDYFWCGMYMDITKFVRDCRLCVDADLPVASVKTLANKVNISFICLFIVIFIVLILLFAEKI